MRKLAFMEVLKYRRTTLIQKQMVFFGSFFVRLNFI